MSLSTGLDTMALDTAKVWALGAPGIGGVRAVRVLVATGVLGTEGTEEALAEWDPTLRTTLDLGMGWDPSGDGWSRWMHTRTLRVIPFLFCVARSERCNFNKESGSRFMFICAGSDLVRMRGLY